jgi:hypothetical protein
MSNEMRISQAEVSQNELTIVRQENEILKLKFELQKVQAQKASRLEDSLFSPNLFPHYQKVAETLAKSGVIPTAYRNKPEDVFVAMAMGYQLGFPVEQSLQDVAVINGRACLWGDGLLSVVLNHPQCEDVKEEPIYSGQNVTGYICTVHRKGHQPHSKTFTLQDAERAGLLTKGGVWKAYPERMLQMRARALALRDKFADALRGLRVAEEIQDESDIIEGEVIPLESNNQVEKLKTLLKQKETKQESPVADKKQTEQTKKQETKQEDNSPITDDNILEIQRIMEEKNFDQVRKLKAMDYFKVSSLSELTNEQAKVFLLQLSKA